MPAFFKVWQQPPFIVRKSAEESFQFLTGDTGQLLIGQHHIRQTGEGNHFSSESTFVIDAFKVFLHSVEIHHAFKEIVSETVKAACAVALGKVFDVNGKHPLFEDLNIILRTAVDTAVGKVEVDAHPL